ncbi:BAHD acyltransferase BIA1-like [Abrus precatorius]|uniref:BAHD acyltransferase BIA1-like n=1 Tax=Abrus precatorius TaxID=3816 RepID=A0A8B8K2S2_ABRPR|nr:BAHD acyltransferase BIA1-like [Abrus precatorius]
MSREIKFEVTGRKCIKPSTATPPQLKTFKLNLLDQLSPNIHGNITFFYSHDPTTHFSTKSQLLQNSLSQVLTLFYPLAGRLQDSAIHCNDEGAFFIETRTNIPLSDILTSPDFDALQCFLPTTDNETMATSNGSLLLVRFTSFACGGTAVTLSLSHKLADMASLMVLLKSWTAVCNGATALVVPDLSIGATLFPPRDIPGMSASVNTVSTVNFTTKRLVFEASKVKELKSKVKTRFDPSRVEVVLALIWKCALLASRSKTTSFKHSILFQAVNLRPRMEPPVPDTAVGNFIWAFAVTVEKGSDMELHVMVSRMRDNMNEFMKTKAEKFKEEGAFGVVMESMKERGEVLRERECVMVFKCSSWCNFPLLKVNFGWGEAVWMSSVNKYVSNTIALMDTKDGGIEAFVTLDQQQMALFEQDQELLHYALINPSVII